MFQNFTAGPGFTADAGKQADSKLPEPAFLDVEPKKILDFAGARGDGLHRLGVMAGPLALDDADAQLRTLIERHKSTRRGHRSAEIIQLAEKCDNDSSEGYLERVLRKPFAT